MKARRWLRPAAEVLAAAAFGSAVGLLLVHWATPCAEATLCAAAAAGVPRAALASLAARCRAALRAWFLRRRIAAADFDLMVLGNDIELLPHQIAQTQRARQSWASELAACETLLAQSRSARRQA